MAQEIADSTLLDTWGSGGNIVEPDISKIIEGWQLGEQPPHEYMNWLQNTFGSKLNHILKNGVASWNNKTEYLAGSSVQYTGNIWLCETTNTNSEPADVNANWKRIITVESLTTVLSGYVKNTGDETIAGVKTFSSNPLSTATQSTNANALTKYSAVVKNTGDETIAGVKTFSSSPIVPTPTTDFQIATKKYVDDNITPEYNPTPTIATGTATFNATTNNINLTGIGIGVEIGDVIQISGADDSKNNSKFTVEVITDNNNIIVNQAHANKGTSKNVANRSGDTGVTVQLLAKWYNAPLGLGQAWVDVTRTANVTYYYLANRSTAAHAWAAGAGGIVFYCDNIIVNNLFINAANSNRGLQSIVPAGSAYRSDSPIIAELR